MGYDSNNIFAKILRGEIPSSKVYEDEHVLAFHDIAPRAAVHVLVIPKGTYQTMSEFSANASEAEIVAFSRAIGKVVTALGIAGTGYRVISNNGGHGSQEVPHMHIHILGGEPLGSPFKN